MKVRFGRISSSFLYQTKVNFHNKRKKIHKNMKNIIFDVVPKKNWQKKTKIMHSDIHRKKKKMSNIKSFKLSKKKWNSKEIKVKQENRYLFLFDEMLHQMKISFI